MSNEYRSTVSQNVRRAPTAVSPGAFNQPWLLPDGAAVADFDMWLQAWINAGYGFQMNIGTLSTPIVGGGNGTVVDLDQPEGIISVPSGMAIGLYKLDAQLLAPLIAADNDEVDVFAAVDKDTAYAGDGTVITETPINLRMNSTRTSSVVARSAATADITDPTHDFELARRQWHADVQGTAANAFFQEMRLAYRPRPLPILFGPCAVYIYWGGTVATSGFAQAEWVEWSSEFATELFGA